MTEAEARKKWCPMSRPDGIGECNRMDAEMLTNLDPLCMASDCMMWRWKLAHDEHEETIDPETHHGYCGLAGS